MSQFYTSGREKLHQHIMPVYDSKTRKNFKRMSAPVPWVPEVFSLLTSGEISRRAIEPHQPKADAMSGFPREKTSGLEHFDLLFSLNFDLFLSYYVQTNHRVCLQWHVKK